MPKIDKAGLAARVRARREKVGLSQKALAQACGMKQQGVDNIEQGIVAKPRNILELAAALHTSPQWLLYKQGPEEIKSVLNPLEQAHEALERIRPDRLGAALEYLKRLGEDEAEVA